MIGARAGKLVSAVLSPWLRATYRSAAGVIAIAPSMAATLVERGARRDRVRTIYNWAPRQGTTQVQLSGQRCDCLRLVYAGNIGAAQDLETVMRGLALVGDGVTLDVYGEGIREGSVRELASDLGLRQVRFHGRVSPEEIARSGADFHIVSLKDLPVFRMTIPSKFQASLALGVPVIASVAGDLAEIVKEENVGFVAFPGDAESFAEAVRKAAATGPSEREAMCLAARRFYESHMSIDAGVAALEDVLIGAARLRESMELGAEE